MASSRSLLATLSTPCRARAYYTAFFVLIVFVLMNMVVTAFFIFFLVLAFL
jgi:hypothetical protein